jgi:FkbM family methyltransferase
MSGIPYLLKNIINGVLGFAGVRLVRNNPAPFVPSPFSADDAGLRQMLTHLGISLVFDVGAHVGQYATRLRNIGYRGRIVSFEPQAGAFAVLSGKAMLDPSWEALHLALGDRDGEQDLNISQNSWSSSFLPVSTDILKVEASIAQIGVERVHVKTLDQVGDRLIASSDKVFLKIDAQGYESQILAGARVSLSRCRAVQIEMALSPSYQGQKLFPEMIEFMSGIGFRLAHLERGFWDARTGYLIEVDGVFVRTN